MVSAPSNVTIHLGEGSIKYYHLREKAKDGELPDPVAIQARELLEGISSPGEGPGWGRAPPARIPDKKRIFDS